MPLHPFKGVSPTLAASCFVAPSASIIGDVVIGEDSSVWFGTVIRGDVFPIRIGARTNIQDNAVVHVTGGRSATTIGDDVTIGHLALVHGCTIGQNCLIGMGSIILDDAVIEDECLIGAGALVTPRMRIPARSLVVGSPARIVRTLSDADVDRIRASALTYVDMARSYRS